MSLTSVPLPFVMDLLLLPPQLFQALLSKNCPTNFGSRGCIRVVISMPKAVIEFKIAVPKRMKLTVH